MAVSALHHLQASERFVNNRWWGALADKDF
jgi:hypothetical protein